MLISSGRIARCGSLFYFLSLMLSPLAFAQTDSRNTLIEVLVLIAILFIMAGLPLYRKMRV